MHWRDILKRFSPLLSPSFAVASEFMKITINIVVKKCNWELDFSVCITNTAVTSRLRSSPLFRKQKNCVLCNKILSTNALSQKNHLVSAITSSATLNENSTEREASPQRISCWAMTGCRMDRANSLCIQILQHLCSVVAIVDVFGQNEKLKILLKFKDRWILKAKHLL